MDLSGTTQGELPIPMHAAASPFAAAAGGGHVLQQQLHHHEHHDNNSNNNGQHESPPAAAAAAAEEGMNSGGKKRAAATAGADGGSSAVKYRECLKNHAAAMGGNATDGCGEFMPSGEEGSLEALKCSACGCHRNFHRKEKELDDADGADHCSGYGHHRRLLAPALPPHHHHHHKNAGGGILVAADSYYAAMRAPPPPLHHHHQFVNTPMPLSAAAMHTSAESDEMDHAMARGGSSSSASRKRFRTKFSAEQKARMLEFAERVGWRLQKLDDAMVQAFCSEIGVKRRVLKVWMHNNKHNLATKRLEAPMASSPPPQMPIMPPPSFHLGGGPSSPPPPQMAMPMVPPPLKLD